MLHRAEKATAPSFCGAQDGAGHLRGFLSAEPSSFRGPGSDADWNLAGGEVTTAMYLLAFLDLLASDRRPATVEAAAPTAGTNLGSSERATAFDHSRYRYDRAHSLRSADGGAQELQPEE